MSEVVGWEGVWGGVGGSVGGGVGRNRIDLRCDSCCAELMWRKRPPYMAGYCCVASFFFATLKLEMSKLRLGNVVFKGELLYRRQERGGRGGQSGG